MTRVRTLARELKIYLAAGLSELRGEQVYNTVVLFAVGSMLTKEDLDAAIDCDHNSTIGTELVLLGLGWRKCLSKSCSIIAVPFTLA